MTFTTRPTLSGTFGMVSSTHWLASQSAQRMLELGGNAFDAAAAGGLRAARRRAAPQRSRRRPAGDRRHRRRPDATGALRAGSCARRRHAARRSRRWASTTSRAPGPLAAAVPGAVDAWLLLLRDHGTPAAGDGARAGDRLRPRRASAARPRRGHDRPGAGPVPRQLDDLGRPVAARRPVPAGGRAVREPGLRLGARAPGRRRVRAPGPDVAAQAQAARDAWGAGSSPRPSRPSAAPSGATRAARCCPGWSAATTSRRTRPPGRTPVVARLARRPGRQDRPVGPGSGTAAGAGDARRARPGRAGPRRPRAASTRSPSAGSWRWPTARRGSATAVPVVGRGPARARRTSPRGPPWSVRSRGSRRTPGAPGGREPRLSRARAAAARRRGDRAHRRRDHGRADRAARRDRARRHLPHRRRRPLGQHRSPRRPSGGWLQSSPTIPELGFCLGSRSQMFWLDEGLPASLVPGRPTAYDAHPDARPARRRAGARLRLTRRRPAGPVAVAVPAAPRRRRHGPPGGDRRPDVPHHQLPRLLPPARDGAGRARRSRTGSPPTCSTGCAGAATRWSRRARGRSGRMCAVSRDPATGVLRAGANPRGMQGYAVGR